jgi:hypothetical protein
VEGERSDRIEEDNQASVAGNALQEEEEGAKKAQHEHKNDGGESGSDDKESNGGEKGKAEEKGEGEGEGQQMGALQSVVASIAETGALHLSSSSSRALLVAMADSFCANASHTHTQGRS